MRARMSGALLAAAVMLVLWSGESAQACSCIGGNVQPCQAYGNARAVFVGVVIGVEEKKPSSLRKRKPESANDAGDDDDFTPRVFSFAVEEAFSGVGIGEAKVATGRGGGDCGYPFAQGGRYLVYAYPNRRGDGIATGICLPTKLATEATEELKFLRGLSSRAAGVTLSGAVTTGYSPDGTPPPVDKRTTGLPLIIEGEGVRRETQTDAEGRYHLTGLKAGTYTIKLVLPDELHTYRAEEKVTIAERGCGGISFYISDNGRTGGKVVDADGVPVPRITINAVLADEVEKDDANMRYAEADAEGNFKFEALPTGRYLLGIRLEKFPQLDVPANAYPRMYYPGVESPAQVERIEVGAGAAIKNVELRLLPRRTARTLRGVVVWADGRPVKKADVSFREITYHRNSNINNGVSTDEEGRFTFKTYDGLTYIFTANSNERPTGNPMHVEPVTVTVSEEMETIKIVIPLGGNRPSAAKP